MQFGPSRSSRWYIRLVRVGSGLTVNCVHLKRAGAEAGTARTQGGGGLEPGCIAPILNVHYPGFTHAGRLRIKTAEPWVRATKAPSAEKGKVARRLHTVWHFS